MDWLHLPRMLKKKVGAKMIKKKAVALSSTPPKSKPVQRKKQENCPNEEAAEVDAAEANKVGK